MRALLRAHSAKKPANMGRRFFRRPSRTESEKYPIEAETHRGKVMSKVDDHFAVGIHQVRENFARFGLLDDQVHFLKGWFKDTLPSAEISQLAIIRLDGDYYESTHDAFAHLYPKPSPGGHVIRTTMEKKRGPTAVARSTTIAQRKVCTNL